MASTVVQLKHQISSDEVIDELSLMNRKLDFVLVYLSCIYNKMKKDFVTDNNTI